MEPTPRQMRLNSTVRGFIIAALIAAYGFLFNRPDASFAAFLLVAAGLQLGVILLRKFVPPALVPQALHVFELLVDAATVFLFALSVYGGIVRTSMEPL